MLTETHRIAVIAPGFLDDKDKLLLLEAKGLKASVATDPSKALENILNDPPDLLVIRKDLPNDLAKYIVKALKDNLRLALLPICLVVKEEDFSANIDWKEYPVDDLLSDTAPVDEVVSRLTLALARIHRVADNNPLTMLPGNTSILKTIQAILDQEIERTVGYVDIDNFKPYNDRYGFSRGDEVIRMTARILVNVIQERAGGDGFVGHVGGDDFVFTVPIEKGEDIAQKVINNFNSLIPLFLDEEDVEIGCFLSKDRQGNEQRFPLTSLSIALIPCWKGRFKHYGEVATVAAQIKKKVKAMPGSNYYIDQRMS